MLAVLFDAVFDVVVMMMMVIVVSMMDAVKVRVVAARLYFRSV
jgi:hypothetical protein